MIKFFRKIRQNLLSEGKTGKYLKYAIGEIVLVVIGILIALAINNWNTNSKLKSEEQTLLKDLQLEVSNNLVSLEEVIAEHRKSHNAAKKIKELSREEFNEMTEKDFRDLFITMDNNWTYDPNNGILNSVISSGQINIISNKELKYLLASIKEKGIDAFEDTMKIEDWRKDLWNQMIKSLFVFEDGKIVNFRYKNLYDKPESRLYIILFNDIRKDGLEEEEDYKMELEHILNLIGREIKK